MKVGECGGSVVECRTTEREVWGSKPTSAMLCPGARHFTPGKYRKWWLNPNMTEKWLTGMLNFNSNKQTKIENLTNSSYAAVCTCCECQEQKGFYSMPTGCCCFAFT